MPINGCNSLQKLKIMQFIAKWSWRDLSHSLGLLGRDFVVYIFTFFPAEYITSEKSAAEYIFTVS